MKVLALILSTFVLTVLILGASIGLALLLDGENLAAFILAIIPLLIFTYGPLIVGSLRTYFDPTRSEDGKRYFRRVLWNVIGLDVLAAVAAVVFTAIIGASFWLPAGAIVVAAGLLALSIVVGDALRKRDDRLDTTEAVWHPFDRRIIVRKIITVAITFVVAFVVVTVAASIALMTAGDGRAEGDALPAAVGFGVILGCFASGLACVVVALPIARALRASLNKDIGQARKFMRIVLRGKNIELDEDERAPAARYASLLAVSLAFNLAYLSLLYAGLVLQNLLIYVRAPEGAAVNGFVTISLVVVYVAFLPLTIRRIRRARRYANDHPELLRQAVAA